MTIESTTRLSNYLEGQQLPVLMIRRRFYHIEIHLGSRILGCLGRGLQRYKLHLLRFHEIVECLNEVLISRLRLLGRRVPGR